MEFEKDENRITGSICKADWIELCKKYDIYCSFEEVQDCTYEQAERYIKNLIESGHYWTPQ